MTDITDWQKKLDQIASVFKKVLAVFCLTVVAATIYRVSLPDDPTETARSYSGEITVPVVYRGHHTSYKIPRYGLPYDAPMGKHDQLDMFLFFGWLITIQVGGVVLWGSLQRRCSNNPHPS